MVARRYIRRPNPSGYLTVRDIAQLTGFHPNTIRSWLYDNLLPYTRGVKDEFLVRRRDLVRFLLRYYNWDIESGDHDDG